MVALAYNSSRTCLNTIDAEFSVLVNDNFSLFVVVRDGRVIHITSKRRICVVHQYCKELTELSK